MISLLARFSGDATPIVEEFKKTERAANKSGDTAGKAFGQQFKSTMLRFIGAGAIIQTVRKAMADAVQIEADALKTGLEVDAFQELNRAAELTGKTVKELQELAPQLASEFTTLMEAVKKSGGFLDKQTVEQLADAAYELNQFTRALAPVISGALKILNFVRGVGQRGLEAASGGAMHLAGALTGNASLRQAGAEVSREAFNTPLDGSSGIRRATERTAAAAFVSAARTQEQKDEVLKQILKEMKDAKFVHKDVLEVLKANL